MFEIAELFFTKWCLGMSSGTPGGGDCTNRSKSGSNRGGQIFRSELLSMCNLLKLAHVAPFVTQPEAIHHWQRSGSREQYRPFGTHVFWDG